ncbi:hypothetical protein [Cohnella yongneupensis]|uniref:Uncharacterized protein n=1 Tax=Cohnella yongneupensis TaxID=425006 RepID=A0ABW0QXU5_9BACL
MNYSGASKPELVQIALFEDCPLDLRYAAARELQHRHKRLIAGLMNQTWWSLHNSVKHDIEKLRHKVLQLRREMEACGVPKWLARSFIDRRVIKRINRQLMNSSAGVARKHVNRKAVRR